MLLGFPLFIHSFDKFFFWTAGSRYRESGREKRRPKSQASVRKLGL